LIESFIRRELDLEIIEVGIEMNEVRELNSGSLVIADD